MTEKTKGLDEKFCSECAAVIKVAAEICPKCGVRQKMAVDQNLVLGSKNARNGKNKMLAAILAFMLGAFGAHKFYLGKPLMGVFYVLMLFSLILSWVPLIASLVEAVIFATMKDEEFDKKYGDIV